jgi:hypothetical protein
MLKVELLANSLADTLIDGLPLKLAIIAQYEISRKEGTADSTQCASLFRNAHKQPNVTTITIASNNWFINQHIVSCMICGIPVPPRLKHLDNLGVLQ